MYCRKCGKEINENAKFCKYCGNPVVKGGGSSGGQISSELPKPQSGHKPGKASSVIGIILLFVAVILILAALTGFFKWDIPLLSAIEMDLFFVGILSKTRHSGKYGFCKFSIL